MNTHRLNQQTSHTTRGFWAALAIATLVAIAIAVPLLAQVEGVDPMRQITRQLGNPNLMIVFDKTGSTNVQPNLNTSSTGYDDYYDGSMYNGLWGFEYSLTPPPTSSTLQSLQSANHYATVTQDFTIDRGATATRASGITYHAPGCSSSSKCYYYPYKGMGNGYWMYVGILPRWTGQGSTVRYRFDPTSTTWNHANRKYIYLLSATTWKKDTIIELNGYPFFASNNGVFKLAADPTTINLGGGLYEYKVELLRIKDDGTTFWPSGSTMNLLQGSSYNRGSMLAQEITLSGVKDSIWYFVEPSRMANQKNALGDTMTVYDAYVKDRDAIAATDAAGKIYYRFPTSGGPRNGYYYDWTQRRWEKNDIANDPVVTDVPPLPDLTLCGASDCVACPPMPDGTNCPKYTLNIPPAKIVSDNIDKVNWGFMHFDNSWVMVENVDPSGNQTTQAANINTYLEPVGQGGLNASGGTSTRSALSGALASLITGATSTANLDEQRTCRPYGVLLVTDGESNGGNPGDTEWYKASSVCPNTWGSYPPGITNDIYNAKWGSVRLNARTWVIGTSRLSAGNCELNMDAFMGRTDRSSPFGDAGYLLEKDYIDTPTGSGMNKKFRLYQSGDVPTNPPGTTYNTTFGDYAFFANNAASITDALKTIISSFGHGDYTTGSPTMSYNSALGNSGNVSLVTSVEFPTLIGRLYEYSVKDCASNPQCDFVWEANAVLSGQVWDPIAGKWNKTATPNLGIRRRIATWNPKTRSLIWISGASISGGETDPATVATTLNGMALGSTVYTAAMVDFIRGYDGTLTATHRPWKLGPIVNSTPAVVAEPDVWEQSTLFNHADFEEYYQKRPAVAWVGSSDGMLHAFDIKDGHEILALLPPDLLKKQAQLYNNYVTYKADMAVPKDSLYTQTGQPKSLSDHIYGIANHIRYNDVYMGIVPPPTPPPLPSPAPSPNPSAYKTVIFLTEGMGGKAVHAIDVTATHPNTVGYDVNNPVNILWNKAGDKSLSIGSDTSNELPGLGLSVSVPSIGARFVSGENHNFQVSFGSGYTTWPPLPTPPATPSPTPTPFPPASFSLNPRDGTPLVSGQNKNNLINETTGTLVKNNGYADTVISSTQAVGYAPDNFTYDMQRIVVDLHGHMYLLGATQSGNPSSASLSVGAGQPLYWAVAAATMSTPTGVADAYALESGTFYERSALVSGIDVGKSTTFQPSIILATRKVTGSPSVAPTYGSLTSVRIPLTKICQPAATNNLQSCTTAGVCACPSGVYLAQRTQFTAPPAIYTPTTGVGPGYALFLVYNPDAEGCGWGYLIKVNFTVADTGGFSAISVEPAKLAYAGMPSGFANSADQTIIISQSGTGSDRAHIVDSSVKAGSRVVSKNRIGYWVELL